MPPSRASEIVLVLRGTFVSSSADNRTELTISQKGILGVFGSGHIAFVEDSHEEALEPGGEVRLRFGYVIRCDEVVKDDEGKIKDPKGGAVSADKLRHIIKEFDLRIDIDRLIAEVDADKSGVIEYDEFAHMMKS